MAGQLTRDLDNDPPLRTQPLDSFDVLGISVSVHPAVILDRDLELGEREVEAREEDTTAIEDVAVQLRLGQTGACKDDSDGRLARGPGILPNERQCLAQTLCARPPPEGERGLQLLPRGKRRRSCALAPMARSEDPHEVVTRSDELRQRELAERHPGGGR